MPRMRYPEELNIRDMETITDEDVARSDAHEMAMERKHGFGSPEHRKAFRLSKRMREQQYKLERRKSNGQTKMGVFGGTAFKEKKPKGD